MFFSEIVLPHLKWHSGKKAQAVRTAAATALWSVLQSKTIRPVQLLDAAAELVPVMNGLVEDGADKIRAFVCKAFRCFFEILAAECPTEILVKSGGGEESWPIDLYSRCVDLDRLFYSRSEEAG